jgi:gliding motility-associated-like protein
MDTLLGVLWSSYFGGDGDDFINDIDAENDSEIFYVGGYTNGAFNLELDSTSAQAESGGLEDGFIAKLNENASHEWFTYSGGPGSDRIVSIKLDIDSSLYAVGITTSDTGLVFFDEDSVPSEFGGGIDSYLARYDDEGPRVFSRYIGGEGNDQAQSLAVFGRTAYFVAGATTSENDMVLTSENQTVAHQDTYRGGGADAFIARFTGLYTTDENICFNCGGGGGGGGSGSGSGGGGSGGSPGPPPDPAVCLGDSFLISIGSAALGSGSQWIWYNDSCGSTDNFFAEGWNVWVQPDTTTTYYVRSESAERVNPCHSFTLIVEEPFDMTASVNDSICAGEPLIFQADSALTYSWVGPDTIAFEGSPYQLDSTTALNIGWYYVTGMGLACVDVDSVEVEVIYPNPFLEADLFNPTCVGLNDGSITLSELDTTIVDFLWTDVGSDTLFRDSLPQGFYPYFAENIYGCTTNSGFGLLEPVNPIDSSTVVPDTCGQHVGAAMAFLSTGWMDNFGLAWSDGLDSNVVNPQGLASGMYYFEAFNEFGCSFEDSLFVGLFGDFTTQIIPDSLYLEFEETAGGEVFNSPEQENETYSWSPAEGLSCSDCSSPIFNPDSTVSFQVLVTSEYGCTASDTIFVEREIPPPTSFIPTIFSPNNDGLNDELCVLGNRMLEVNLSIYNRWGEEVFSTSQKESCWDGNFNGQPVSGTLVYTFTALLEEGITVEESGNIQILR